LYEESLAISAAKDAVWIAAWTHLCTGCVGALSLGVLAAVRRNSFNRQPRYINMIVKW
jgi:hypothetical protein